MKRVKRQEMRAVEEKAIQHYGISAMIMMEHAGLAVAKSAMKMNIHQPIVFCGKGNNGGDGFVAARHLHNHGREPLVITFQGKEKMPPEPLFNYEILEQIGCERVSFLEGIDLEKIKALLQESDGVIDALFGTGLNRDLSADWVALVESINASGKRIIAVDIPSGLDADTGEVLAACVKAELTVTLGLPKAGFLKGRPWTGQVEVADISLPRVEMVDFLESESAS